MYTRRNIYPVVRELTEIRRKAHIPLDTIAEKSGYSVSHLMKIEAGHRQPSLSAFSAWADTLGCYLVLKDKLDV